MKTGAVLGIGIAVAALASGCGNKPEPVKAFTASGYLEVDQPQPVSAGKLCVGYGDYGDITTGTEVIVKDSKGAKVGLSHLGTGKATSDGSGCRFAIKVSGIKSRGSIFTLTVGTRGDLTFKRSEASSIAATLGG